MSWLPDILQHALAFEVVVVTPYTFVTILAPAILSYYVMAVLVQLPRTGFYRAALLPVALWLVLRANMSLDFSWNYPGYDYLNQGLALGMFTVAMRSTTWVLAERPYTRLPIRKWHSDKINGYGGKTPSVSIPLAMWNACDLIVNLRGLGWNGPPKAHVPTPYFHLDSRLTFALLSFCRTIILVLAFDTLHGIIRSYGGDAFRTPQGGTIFDPSLPPVERYMKSSIITLILGFVAYLTIEVVYQICTVSNIVLFYQYPTQWPPLFDSPWSATSLHSFWSQRWHQVFRECFVALGSQPLEKYFGRAGAVMGAFIVSGILHDVGMRGMGRGGDTLMVMGFFLMHGVGIMMEYAWKRATGRRVGGVIGWLWVYSWHILWGQFLMDVWARQGLLASEFFLDDFRPTTLVLNWISENYGPL